MSWIVVDAYDRALSGYIDGNMIEQFLWPILIRYINSIDHISVSHLSAIAVAFQSQAQDDLIADKSTTVELHDNLVYSCKESD